MDELEQLRHLVLRADALRACQLALLEDLTNEELRTAVTDAIRAYDVARGLTAINVMPSL